MPAALSGLLLVTLFVLLLVEVAGYVMSRFGPTS
jgi:hypothetical protein